MPVVGDPAGMRTASAQLRLRAGRFSVLAAEVESSVASMSFAGPAADRWRPAVGDQSNRLRAAAERLEQDADLLVREAALVEDEQHRESLTAEGPSQ